MATTHALISQVPTVNLWYYCNGGCLCHHGHHNKVLFSLCTQFLNCLQRFVSQREKLDPIISDNAPQFKLTSTALSKQWKNVFVDKKFCHSSWGIKWNFITALAPWRGGFYERLVGMVKRCFRKTTGRRHFTLEQLTVLLTEIEAVLNLRPLIYVNKDFESSFVLTPSHFLVMNIKLGLPAIEDEYFKDVDYLPDKSSTT